MDRSDRRMGVDPTMQWMVNALENRVLKIDETAPFANGFVHLTPRGPDSSGSVRTATLKPGFSLFLTDVQYGGEHLSSQDSGDHLKFHFKLGGDSIISGEHSESVAVPPGVMSFLVQPRHSVKQERIRANTHERSVTMVCSQEFASSLLSPSARGLPTPIGEFLTNRVSRFELNNIPLPRQMRASVEGILEAETGPLGHLRLEAKALELLYLALNQLVDEPSGHDAVRPRDQKRVDDLRMLLQSAEGASLSLTELCRLLAWNETQMMQAFKQVTGSTISSYRQQVRMDRALRQLKTTDASITEVAMDAGYEHPSNFATAFKRTFGFSPKVARQAFN